MSSLGTRLLQGIENQSRKIEAMHTEQNIQNILLLEREKERDRKFKFALFYTIFSVFMFVYGNIYTQRFKFPIHFKWWDQHKRRIPDLENGGIIESDQSIEGKGRWQYTMYQVVVAAFYPSMHSLLNTFTIYQSLHSLGARFLLNCVNYFETNPKTTGKLSVIHWCGNKDQTLAQNLFKCPNGWLSAGSPSGEQQIHERKNIIKRNWIRSKKKNIWYDFFPDPTVNSHGFFSVPIIKEMVEKYETCGDNGADAFSGLYRLYDGGLCAVAADVKLSDSAVDTFKHYFGAEANHKPSCSGAAAQGAVNGATGVGMSSLGLMDLGGTFSAGATGAGAFMGVVAGLSIVGGVIGGVVGAAAAEEACKNKAAF